MKIQAIIPAAGQGTRLQSRKPKPLVHLGRMPIIAHTLSVFERCPVIDSIIVVVPKESQKDFSHLVRRSRLKKVKAIVPGGATRAASVRCGLQALDRDTEFVVVHDGARPLLTRRLLEAAVAAAVRAKAVSVAVPVKPTIKRVDPKRMTVRETLPRQELWEIQTPQVFRKDLLIRAHAKTFRGEPTDDAVLVEKLGVKVKIVMGEYTNIKVTTREDLAVAQAILRKAGSR